MGFRQLTAGFQTSYSRDCSCRPKLIIEFLRPLTWLSDCLQSTPLLTSPSHRLRIVIKDEFLSQTFCNTWRSKNRIDVDMDPGSGHSPRLSSLSKYSAEYLAYHGAMSTFHGLLPPGANFGSLLHVHQELRFQQTANKPQSPQPDCQSWQTQATFQLVEGSRLPLDSKNSLAGMSILLLPYLNEQATRVWGLKHLEEPDKVADKNMQVPSAEPYGICISCPNIDGSSRYGFVTLTMRT